MRHGGVHTRAQAHPLTTHQLPVQGTQTACRVKNHTTPDEFTGVPSDEAGVQEDTLTRDLKTQPSRAGRRQLSTVPA